MEVSYTYTENGEDLRASIIFSVEEKEPVIPDEPSDGGSGSGGGGNTGQSAGNDVQIQEQDSVVGTGDDAVPVIVVVLLLISAAGIAVIAGGRRRS